MQFKFYILAFLIGCALTACTTEIDIHLNVVSAELVVEGAITTDTTTHVVYLKKTADYFSNKSAEVVSGAKVTVSDGTTQITLVEDISHKGAYQTPSNYYGVVGKTYTLTVSNVDIDGDGVSETYSASSVISTKPPLEKIAVKKTKIFNKDMWAVKIWMQEPANEKNYYMGLTYKNNVCTTDSIQEVGKTSDEFFDGAYLKDETFMYFSSEKSDEILQNGDVIMFEICGITKDYFGFLKEAEEEFRGRNPLFGGQPANIRTNIKQVLPVGGKASPRGYFAAYSVSRAKTVYKE
jgi:hypothetical protein